MTTLNIVTMAKDNDNGPQAPVTQTEMKALRQASFKSNLPGAVRKLSADQVNAARKMARSGVRITVIAKAMGVSFQTAKSAVMGVGVYKNI